MCFGQRLRGSRPRRKIGADTLKPRRALGKTWEQAPTAFEAAQLIKPPALRGVSDSLPRSQWVFSQMTLGTQWHPDVENGKGRHDGGLNSFLFNTPERIRTSDLRIRRRL